MRFSGYADQDGGAGTGKWAAILAGTVLAMHLPSLGLHLFQMSKLEHLQHVLIIPLAVAFIASQFVKAPGELAPESGGRVWAIFLLGLALLAVGALLRSPLLTVLALAANSAGVILACGGPPLFRALLPAWLCLLLLLRPPFNLDEEMLAHLQRVTVKGCERLYEWGGGLCLVSGATIQIPGATPLGVDAPCSGVNSLFATFTCAALLLAWQRRGPVHSALTLLGSLGWVMIANVLRVLAVMVWSSPTLDLTKGWRHSALGFLTFAFALGMTISLDRLLLFFNPARIPDEDELAAVGNPEGWRGLRARPTLAAPAAALFLAVGLLGLAAFFGLSRKGLPPLDYRFEVALDGNAALPATIGAWRFDGYQHIIREENHGMASRSHAWAFRNGLWRANVSLDYSYPSYHDLQPCYQNIGWSLSARDNGAIPPQFAMPPGDFVRLRMARNEDDRHLFVAFVAFEDNGQPHPVGVWGQLLDVGMERLWNDVRGRLTGADTRLVKRVYQIQVTCESQFQFTPELTAQLETLLFECRKRLQLPHLTIKNIE